MIIFDKVTKKYPYGNIALDEVSFEVADNEFVFLVGPSGAGKTTILKLLLREYAPNSGHITVNDTDIASKKFHSIPQYRQRIGVVFQDFKILQDKNVFENIALSLQITGHDDRHIKEEVHKTLDLVSLSHKVNMFPSQLSAGELQRVAIARAVIGDRDIILADEPTGNLDPKTTWEIMRIFKKLESTKTILFATHNTDIVNSLKRRVLALKDGKLVKDLRKGGYEV